MALAAWCDLVSRCLASGRGVDQSVTTAARAGSGWAFGELRRALAGGSVRGQTPWASLEQLGVELGVEDLRELASTIGMAGEEGAAVREAVATRARTIRERVTTETERIAEAATAQMPMPTFVVAMGFLVFLGFPALAALSRSGF
jgi:Flp pilus assembly protein TadB